MLFAGLIFVTTLFAAQIETSFTVEYAGKKYEFRISDEDLQKTPVWASGQENPPLSPRRAVDVATRQLASLLPNGKDWRLYAVTLRPVENRWIYLVEFLEPLRGNDAAQQVSAGFQVVVLMNGSAVVPRISP